MLLLLEDVGCDFSGAIPAYVGCEVSTSFRSFVYISVFIVCRKLDSHMRRIIGLANPGELVSAVALDTTSLPGGDGAKVSVAEDGGVGEEFCEDCVQAVADEDSGFFFGSIAIGVGVGNDAWWKDLHRALRGGAHTRRIGVGLYHSDCV